ncbi:MAG: protein kinase [Myxococcales bacterium]|nr:protein kinase [Myxococcales bacterium]
MNRDRGSPADRPGAGAGDAEPEQRLDTAPVPPSLAPGVKDRSFRLGQASTEPRGDLWEGPRAGELIDGTYRVIGPLGQGGMGTVLLAVDERLERDVAIKLIRPSYAATDNARRRFLIEARAMARVRHENVIEIYTFGEIDDAPYFVMEYVPGTSVGDWLDELMMREKLPTIDEALGYLDQICRGVAAIHVSGSVHGDLKPSNILLGPSSRVAIADMGLSRLFDRSSGEPGDHPMAGTPGYIAPEYARTDLPPHILQRSDVYSLGVLAYEMLTGSPPFDIKSAADMLAAHHSTPEPPSSRRPELTRAFDAPILEALESDPVNRTASVEELRRALLRARESLDASHAGLRILVADDDDDFRQLARETLDYGFPGAQIELVSDGKAALVAADAQPMDLAVIDLDMPGLNGVELTAALRERHDMPIIVCTAAGGAPDWKLLSAIGADGFLVKPIDPFAFVALARKMLDASSERASSPD